MRDDLRGGSIGTIIRNRLGECGTWILNSLKLLGEK